MNRRTLLLLIVTFLLLAGMAWQCAQYMDGCRSLALQASADALASREIAQQILHLRQRPALAADQEQDRTKFASLLEKAAQAAHIPAETFDASIKHGEARRIGDSAYKEKPTQLTIRKVTMEQLVVLLHSLLSSSPQLHVKSIDLSAPRDDLGGNVWSADVVVTYWIYEPLQGSR